MNEDNSEHNFQLLLDSHGKTQIVIVALIDGQKELSQKVISFIDSGLLHK